MARGAARAPPQTAGVRRPDPEWNLALDAPGGTPKGDPLAASGLTAPSVRGKGLPFRFRTRVAVVAQESTTLKVGR